MLNGDVLIFVVCYIGIDVIIMFGLLVEKDFKKVFNLV